jgi:hypothetical protein
VISDLADLPSATGGDYEVTVSVGTGILRYYNDTFVTCGSLSLTGCSGANTGTVTLRGAMENVNAALNTIHYLGNLNYEGLTLLTWTVDDKGTSGSGGPLTASIVAVLNVLPQNDAPVISVPSTAPGGCLPDLENRTCLPVIDNFRPREDCVSAVYSGISFSDVDNKGDNYTMWVASRYGTWSSSPIVLLWATTTGGAVFERGDGIDDRSMMVHGPLATLNILVQSLQYLSKWIECVWLQS